MDKKVFIILLNYKGVEDTLECVKSLDNIEYNNYEIVIVDNNSPDNSFDILNEKLGPKHHIISSGKNGGFAYGNNVGINFAMDNGADYVLLINNDTTVEKDFLKELVKSLELDEFYGIATGLILNYYDKSKVWFAGGEINWDRFYGYHLNENDNVNNISLNERKITFATGCLMLIKREVIDKVGCLPEEYFMYYEDVDYCAKIQEEGYNIIYNPKSVIYHKISAASGEAESPFSIKWNTKNRIRFMQKYKHRLSMISYIKLMSFFYMTRIIKFAKYILNGRKDKAAALIEGLKMVKSEQ